MGKNSALLMFDPDRLIGKLISNVVLSMRETHWLLKGIKLRSEKDGKLKSLLPHLLAEIQMCLILQAYRLQEETAKSLTLACTYPKKSLENSLF